WLVDRDKESIRGQICHRESSRGRRAPALARCRRHLQQMNAIGEYTRVDREIPAHVRTSEPARKPGAHIGTASTVERISIRKSINRNRHVRDGGLVIYRPASKIREAG